MTMHPPPSIEEVQDLRAWAEKCGLSKIVRACDVVLGHELSIPELRRASPGKRGRASMDAVEVALAARPRIQECEDRFAQLFQGVLSAEDAAERMVAAEVNRWSIPVHSCYDFRIAVGRALPGLDVGLVLELYQAKYQARARAEQDAYYAGVAARDNARAAQPARVGPWVPDQFED